MLGLVGLSPTKDFKESVLDLYTQIEETFIHYNFSTVHVSLFDHSPVCLGPNVCGYFESETKVCIRNHLPSFLGLAPD